jgi:Protein of unknown function (DUF3606)
MADDPKIRGPQDRTRINLHQEHEVRYWTTTLGVSKEQLEAIVRQVGDSVEAVKAEITSAAH